MAFKFGSIFEQIIEQPLREAAKKARTHIDSASQSMSNFAQTGSKSIDAMGDNLTAQLGSALDDAFGQTIRKGIEPLKGALDGLAAKLQYEKSIIKDLEKELAKTSKETQQYKDIQEQLAESSAKVAKYQESFNTVADKLPVRKLNDFESALRKQGGAFEEVNVQFTKGLTDLRDKLADGTIDTNMFADSLRDLEFTRMGDEVKEVGADIMGPDKGAKTIGAGKDVMGSAISSAISAFSPALGPVADMLGTVIVEAGAKAVKQLIELNKTLLQITRSTGGLITNAALGMDSMGNLAGSIQSLETMTMKANISTEEFSKAITKLFASGFGSQALGNIIGMTDNIKKSGKELQRFGVESARMTKLFNADFSDMAKRLLMDFGASIDQVTDIMLDAAEAARAAGVSVEAMATNFAEAAAMSGDIFFARGAEGMQELALLATKLGTSVETVGKGMIQMNSITDLFEQQQKSAALGMHKTGKALAEVFALKQMGRTDEAAKVELAAMAGDVEQFTDEKGQVSQQGIAQASAMGADKEQIKALQRLTMQAAKTGLSFEQIVGPTEDLTRAQRRRLDAEEEANKTIGERGNIMLGTLTQSFIDPLAKALKPTIDMLLQIGEHVIPMIAGVFDVLFAAINTILGPIQTLGTQLFALIMDVVTPMKDGFMDLKDLVVGFLVIFEGLANLIITVVMVPLRLLGKVIGGLISIALAPLKAIGEKMAPIFEQLSGLFGEGTGALDEFIEVVGDVFAGLADIVGVIVGGVFDILVGVITLVIKGLGLLWDGIVMLAEGIYDVVTWPFKQVWKLLQPILDPLAEVFSDLWDAIKDLWDGMRAAYDWIMSWFGSDDAGELATNKQVSSMLSVEEAKDLEDRPVSVGSSTSAPAPPQATEPVESSTSAPAPPQATEPVESQASAPWYDFTASEPAPETSQASKPWYDFTASEPVTPQTSNIDAGKTINNVAKSSSTTVEKTTKEKTQSVQPNIVVQNKSGMGGEIKSTVTAG